MATKQLAKVFHNGTHRVIWDDTKEVNAYRVTYNGRKVADYDNLESCLYLLADVVSLGDTGETRDVHIVLKGVK